MILPFSTKINGKETFFVEKIHKSLREFYFDEHLHLFSFQNDKFNHNFYHRCIPKLHTIREDKNDRWKVGTKIDFFINVRQKNMFRFAPVLPLVSTQKIEIIYEFENNNRKTRPVVWIYDMVFYDPERRCDKGMLELAKNDGFNTIEDFFDYFDKDYVGKIIHWTGLTY
ncbi:hypothetical protein [Flavobacterium sp.]|uniref:hypothetical protein n=1 Tax=Flavobacterium sp. TaxID=239 RepID=UPI0037526003